MAGMDPFEQAYDPFESAYQHSKGVDPFEQAYLAQRPSWLARASKSALHSALITAPLAATGAPGVLAGALQAVDVPGTATTVQFPTSRSAPPVAGAGGVGYRALGAEGPAAAEPAPTPGDIGIVSMARGLIKGKPEAVGGLVGMLAGGHVGARVGAGFGGEAEAPPPPEAGPATPMGGTTTPRAPQLELPLEQAAATKTAPETATGLDAELAQMRNRIRQIERIRTTGVPNPVDSFNEGKLQTAFRTPDGQVIQGTSHLDALQKAQAAGHDPATLESGWGDGRNFWTDAEVQSAFAQQEPIPVGKPGATRVERRPPVMALGGRKAPPIEMPTLEPRVEALPTAGRAGGFEEEAVSQPSQEEPSALPTEGSYMSPQGVTRSPTVGALTPKWPLPPGVDQLEQASGTYGKVPGALSASDIAFKRGKTLGELTPTADHPLVEQSPSAAPIIDRIEQATDTPMTDDQVAQVIRNKAKGLGERGATPIVEPWTLKGAWEGLRRMYYAAMISGVSTVYKIAASNPIYSAWKSGPVAIGATAIDHVLRGVTGVVGKEALGTTLSRAAAKRGWAEGWEDGKRVLMGEPPLLGKAFPGGAFQLRESIGPWRNVPVLGPVAQAAVSLVSRTHGFLHRMGWTRAYEYAKIARAQVLTKNALPNLKGSDFTDAVMRLVNNPTPELDTFATEAANEATLLNPNIVSEAVSGGRKWVERRLGGAAGFGAEVAETAVLPFSRIGPNLIIQGLRNTPVGFPLALVNLIRLVKARYLEHGIEGEQLDLLHEQRGFDVDKVSRLQGELAQRLSEAGAGTAAAFSLGVLGAKMGFIAPGVARSPQERQWMDANGVPNFGVNVGKIGGGADDYRSALQLLGPLGVAVQMGAAWQYGVSNPQNTADDGFWNQIVGHAQPTALLEPIAEEQTLTGVRELGETIRAIGTGQKAAEPAVSQFVQQRAVAAVPAIVQQIARQLDPVVRDPETFGEVLRSALPISHEQIPPKLGAFKLPLQRRTSPFSPLPGYPSEGIPLSFSKPILDYYAQLAIFDHTMTQLNAQLVQTSMLPPSEGREQRLNEITQRIVQHVQALAGAPNVQ